MRIINAEIESTDAKSFKLKNEMKWISIKDPILLNQWAIYRLSKNISFECETVTINGDVWKRVKKFLTDDEIKEPVVINKATECLEVIGELESKSSTGFKLVGDSKFYSVGNYRIQYLNVLEIGQMVKIQYRVNKGNKKTFYNVSKIEKC
jgi:hypothetical protein